MRETRQQTTVVEDRPTVLQTDSVESTNPVGQIVYLVFGILEAILAIRIILSLLGANRGNAFAQLIYSITYPFVAPFFGLFGYQFQYGVARLEIETLVAMLVYALIGWVIIRLTQIGRRV